MKGVRFMTEHEFDETIRILDEVLDEEESGEDLEEPKIQPVVGNWTKDHFNSHTWGESLHQIVSAFVFSRATGILGAVFLGVIVVFIISWCIFNGLETTNNVQSQSFNSKIYLRSVCAKDIEVAVYPDKEDTVYEMTFDINKNSYLVKTTVFSTETNTFGLYTVISVDTGDVLYRTMPFNSGSFVVDERSSMLIDAEALEVLHGSTDETLEIQSDYEGDCPFSGLGIVYCEIDHEGTIIWYDESTLKET